MSGFPSICYFGSPAKLYVEQPCKLPETDEHVQSTPQRTKMSCKNYILNL